MPTIQVTVDIKEDGQTLPGFPVTKSVTVLESLGRATVERISAAGFPELPLNDLNDINVLYVRANEATTLRFNDQTDQGLPMLADGFLLMVGSDIPDSASSKAGLQNLSGSTATVTTISAGN